MAATRAKDTDREDTCKILDAALEDGELSTEEHRERVSSATAAVTLAELHALIADLQQSSSPVRLQPLPTSPKSGRLGIAAAALVVAGMVGLGIGWALHGHPSSPASVNAGANSGQGPAGQPGGVASPLPSPPKQLQTLAGLTGLLDQARRKFGDTMGLRLVVYPDYAVLDRADPAEQRRELSYVYRGGWDGPNTSPRTGGAVVDLSRFDAGKAVAIIAGAPDQLGIKKSDVTSTYLIVQPSDDPTAPGAVSLSAYVSADYGSGYIKFTGDGTVQQMLPPS